MTTAKIILKNEVSCSIENLDLDTRKKLSQKYSYFVPSARYSPQYRLGRWDGKTSYFSIGGSTYNNLLEDIVPDLIASGYEIEVDDRRLPFHIGEIPTVTEHTFSHILWQDGHPFAGQSVTLREHQVTAINKFIENPQCIQELSTSAGKTIICSALSYLLQDYGKTIIIVPNKTLVEQTYADYINFGLDVGVYYGDRKETDKTHTICTWQSLESLERQKRDEKRIDAIEEFVDGVCCVIVDECFSGDTPILTPSGYVAIKNIKEGDIIINYNEHTNQYKEDVVVDVYKNMEKSNSEDMLKLEFDNGNIVEVTANHKFLTDVGWVRADELNDDMQIISYTKNTESMK